MSLKKGITIPSTVTSIGDYAFYGCTGLTIITIPSSLTSIGKESFEFCTSLSEIRVNADVPPILGSNTFNLVDTTKCTLYVPTGSLNAYKTTDQWKAFLNIVEFDPTGVENPGTESMKIYPNPASRFIHIDLVDTVDSQFLRIFNVAGKKLYERHESGKQIHIDVSSYPSGFYFIQTTDKNNRVTNIGRFIKELQVNNQ